MRGSDRFSRNGPAPSDPGDPRDPGGSPGGGGSGRRYPRPRGALEREVLECLSGVDGALTPAEVLGRLGGGLAYTTVMTTLARLHGKGVLHRVPAGRAFAYSLTGDQDAVRSIAVAHKMRQLLEGGTDRAGVLAHFVADLGPEDEQLLTSLLAHLGDAHPGDGRTGPAGDPGAGDPGAGDPGAGDPGGPGPRARRGRDGR